MKRSAFLTASEIGRHRIVSGYRRACGAQGGADRNDTQINNSSHDNYSNTLRETRANGTQSYFTFNADHTFRSTNQDGKVMTGSWTLNAQSETCIAMDGSDRPPPPCAKLQAQKVGDSWDRQGPAGNEHFVLESGRK